jgi:secondary thiamine-phosphate synthase enzyme
MDTRELDINASSSRIVDLTTELAQFCAGRGDGLVNAFVPHATAGLALMETGSGSESDLLAALERILPRDDRYRHAHGSAGHGADHLLPVLVSPSVTLPVIEGRVALGTWQSLVLVDLNVDNPWRRVRFSFVAGWARGPTGGCVPSRKGLPNSASQVTSLRPWGFQSPP